MTVTLFLFAMVSLLLVHAYWLSYTLMHPEIRMPFAANEIGEISVFLLLSAMMDSVFREIKVSAKREIIFTIFFSAASVALWIVWTGEWIQDIIDGAAFGYFLCVCVRALKQSNALKKIEWRVPGITGALTLSMIFHALYNLLVSERGITSAIGYGLPLITAAAIYIVYRKRLLKKDK